MTTSPPRSRRLALFASSLALFALCAACAVGDSINARVECEGTNTDVVCDVTHLSGPAGNVCWDVRFRCANGTVSEGTGCADVQPGGTAQHLIPVTSLSNYGLCDQATSTEIVNLRQGT